MNVTRTSGYLRRPVLLIFLVSAIMMLVTLVMYFQLPPVVPIFYSLARETQHLADQEWIFLLPGTSLILSFIHLSLLKRIKEADEILVKFFIWTTVGLQIMLGLAWLRIILIVS